MITFRSAAPDDLIQIVTLLADDVLGSGRESPGEPLDERYLAAFAAIAGDPNNEIIVAVDGATVTGVLQLTFIPGLTHRGAWRAQIEGVRVASLFRGRGIGRGLIRHAIEQAVLRGCPIVQLTTDKARPEAVRFYESLGFRATHEGLKLHLTARGE